MKLEFTNNKDNNKPSFKEGDIVAVKADDNLDGTTETNYYLIGLFDKDYDIPKYYLTNIKTGVMVKISFKLEHADTERWFSKDVLLDIIKCYDGKIYRQDEAKLILEKNN